MTTTMAVLPAISTTNVSSIPIRGISLTSTNNTTMSNIPVLANNNTTIRSIPVLANTNNTIMSNIQVLANINTTISSIPTLANTKNTTNNTPVLASTKNTAISSIPILANTNNTTISSIPVRTNTKNTSMSSIPVLSTTTTNTATISNIPVQAIPIPNTNKLILAGPCIVLRAATVAEQVQALRKERKVTATTATLTTESSLPEPRRCKKRAGLVQLGVAEAKPSMSRRNARERNRVKQVNQGFDTLRQHVPGGKKNRKMSKVDTLRSAIDYIRGMEDMIRQHDKKMTSVDNLSETTPLSSHQDNKNLVVLMSTKNITIDSEQCNENTAVPMLVDSEENENATGCCSTSHVTSVSETAVVNVHSLDKTSVVCEKTSLDNINNNNNTFINFNMEANGNGTCRKFGMNTVDTGNSLNALRTLTSIPKGNSVQVDNINKVVLLNNVNSACNPQANNTDKVLQFNHVNTANNDASCLQPLTSSVSTETPPSATMSSSTIAVITLPMQQQFLLPNTQPHSEDHIFMTDPQHAAMTSSGATPISSGSKARARMWNTITTTSSSSSSRTSSSTPPGNTTTLTTLQGLGSLSGQSFSFTLNQPCRRHLSFAEPEQQRPPSVPQKLLTSEQIQTLLLAAQQQQQQQQQEESQQAGQPQIRLSRSGQTMARPEENATSCFPLPLPTERQQLEDSQQRPEQPVYATLANVFLPSQSANTVSTLDQSTNTKARRETDCQNQLYQRLVVPGNGITRQGQGQVDQAPSPSLSSMSSHNSESSYEGYESLGSLEEDLQDLSDWITQLCKSASDIHNQDGVDVSCHDFLTYNHDLL